jgi:hypothetical protein
MGLRLKHRNASTFAENADTCCDLGLANPLRLPERMKHYIALGLAHVPIILEIPPEAHIHSCVALHLDKSGNTKSKKLWARQQLHSEVLDGPPHHTMFAMGQIT